VAGSGVGWWDDRPIEEDVTCYNELLRPGSSR
jgi:hypothetical protein